MSTEESLKAIWASVLSVDPAEVTLESDFFASGGNSLQVGQLLARVGEELGVSVPVAQFFVAPEFGELVRLADSA